MATVHASSPLSVTRYKVVAEFGKSFIHYPESWSVTAHFKVCRPVRGLLVHRGSLIRDLIPAISGFFHRVVFAGILDQVMYGCAHGG